MATPQKTPTKTGDLDAIDAALAQELTPAKKTKAAQVQIATILKKRNSGKPLTDREQGSLDEYEDRLELGRIPRHVVTGKVLPRFCATDRAAASALGISIDAVRRAKRDGCGAFRNSKIYTTKLAVWCEEQNIPWGEETTKGAMPSTQKREAPADPLDRNNMGAGKALLRLEEEEARSHAAYVVLVEDPSSDEDTRAQRHATWLRCSRELLRYEAQLEAAKRDSGEVIPRPEVVRHCRALISWFRAGLSDSLHRATPYLAGAKTSVDAAAIWDPAARESIELALQSGQRAGLLPGWLAESAFGKSEDQLDAEAGELDTLGLVRIAEDREELTKTDRAHLRRIAKKIDL